MESAPRSASSLHPRRLLLVEDHLATADALSRFFRRTGWDVTVAGTLAEGIAGLSPTPNWVILDLMLPDGDGNEVLAAIRERGLETRVVITTGSAPHAHLTISRDLEPDAILIKPVDLFVLDGLLKSPRPPEDA